MARKKSTSAKCTTTRSTDASQSTFRDRESKDNTNNKEKNEKNVNTFADEAAPTLTHRHTTTPPHNKVQSQNTTRPHDKARPHNQPTHTPGAHNTAPAHKPHTPRRNRFPVPAFDSACLVCSSLFFLLPALQALLCAQPYYCLLSVITSLVSVNYWRYAVPGWRRTLDLVTAKLSFVVYFTTGALYVTDPRLHVIGWPICVLILLAYWLSGLHWQRDHWQWVCYHMAFHFFVAVEQSLVIGGSFEQCHPFELYAQIAA